MDTYVLMPYGHKKGEYRVLKKATPRIRDTHMTRIGILQLIFIARIELVLRIAFYTSVGNLCKVFICLTLIGINSTWTF